MSAELTTPGEAASRAKNNRIALGYIFIAVISYALVPTLIGHIGGDRLPFFFMGAWRAGGRCRWLCGNSPNLLPAAVVQQI